MPLLSTLMRLPSNSVSDEGFSSAAKALTTSMRLLVGFIPCCCNSLTHVVSSIYKSFSAKLQQKSVKLLLYWLFIFTFAHN